jgi:hypothetical protein
MRLGTSSTVRAAVTGTAFVAALSSSPCLASEGGASFYLLGGSGPEAAVMPPVEGVFFDNTIYIYGGSANAEREFVIGGNLVADVDATLMADFVTVTLVPTTDLLGGTLAIGGSLPVGVTQVGVSARVTGPGGGNVTVSRHDSAVLIGDPVVAGALGWQADKFHVQASATVNVPIGQYRDGELANVAFHRWIVDASLAGTWNDPEVGWDLSAKAGLTFNGENPATDYRTGTEFHLEGSVEKAFSPAISAGLQGYYFRQVTGDSGAGATLGPFKGEVVGIGATTALNVTVGRMPATLRVRAFKEFNATNRLSGEAFFLSFTMPLQMNLPSETP